MHTKSTLKLVDALKHATSLHKHAPLPYRHHLATLFNFILFTSIKLYAFSNYYLTIMLVIRWNYSAFALLCIILCVCIIILPSMAMLKAAPLYRSGGGGAHCCGMIYALNDLWGTIWWLLRWWWCMNAHANHKLVLARTKQSNLFWLMNAKCKVNGKLHMSSLLFAIFSNHPQIVIDINLFHLNRKLIQRRLVLLMYCCVVISIGFWLMEAINNSI